MLKTNKSNLAGKTVMLWVVSFILLALSPGNSHADNNMWIKLGTVTGTGATVPVKTSGGTTIPSASPFYNPGNNAYSGTLVLTAAAGWGVASASINNGTTTTDVTGSLTGWNSTDRTTNNYHNSCNLPYSGGGNGVTFTINVVFKQLITVTSSVSGGGGTISPTGTSYWLQSETATFTATPTDSSYSAAVSDTATTHGSLSGTTYTLGNIIANCSVTATFARRWAVTTYVSAAIGSSGSISPAPSASPPMQVADGGNSGAIVVTAATGSIITDVILDEGTGTQINLGPQTSPYTLAAGAVPNPATAPNAIHEVHTVKAKFDKPSSSMMQYCNVPAFLSTPLKPNLLLMLDNSASMYDLAYTNSAANSYCFDNTYSNTATYYGYFAQGTNYRFLGTFSTGVGKFIVAGDKPTTCDYGTAYFCITTDHASPATVTSFWGSANFLNWLTSSKLDQQKLILTGGRYDTAAQVLISESRGCDGRRYVKVDPNFTTISFGVRGPNHYDPDYVSQSTQGGDTRIELFAGTYDKTHCQLAIDDWTNPGSIGAIGSGPNSNTALCLGVNSGDLKSSAYNHITHLCYRSLKGDNPNAELTPMEGDCASLYTTIYSNDPSRITNETGGDSICASTLPHALFNGNEIGYMGQCWTLAGGWNDACAIREIADFCQGAHGYDAIDPSGDAQSVVGTAGLAPSFILDAGLTGLGSPIATMTAHVSLAAQPRKLIQEFQDVINFGTMQFNKDGSGTECGPLATVQCAKGCNSGGSFTGKQCSLVADCNSGETCDFIPKLDGAVISSYLDYTPIGDHSSTGGLINNIDTLSPSTWTPLAEGFYNAIGYYGNRSDMHLNSAINGAGLYDYDATKNPSNYVCRQNYVLLISDGGSTVDQNATVNALATAHPGPSAQTGTCSTSFLGSRNLDDLVGLANTKNIQDTTWTATPAHNNENIVTYAVFTGKEGTGTDECLNPSLLMDHAAANGGTGQTAAYRANNYPALETSLRNVFAAVASRITSGTAASILSNSQGSGANILQAIFYPVKTFDNLAHSTTWIGEMQNLWYYIDPFIGNSSIREDTDSDLALNLISDYVARFVFNNKTNQTEVQLLKNTNGDGVRYTPPLVSSDTRLYNYPTATPPDTNTYTSADNVKALWRAGRTLWSRDGTSSSSNPRNIYTQTAGALQRLDSLDTSTSTAGTENKRLLQASNQTEANNIISYIGGDDTVNGGAYRQRGLVINGVAGTWKLGDIIDSTPRIQSSNESNNYDLPPPAGYKDASYQAFVSTNSYRNRGMAYVGANDGMLHAFKVGNLISTPSGNQKGTLFKGTSGVLGNEEWSFIPKNALPYLKYLADPLYPHLYYVDGTPTIFDASIGGTACTNYWDCVKDTAGGTNWRTLLVQGMGLGGACRNKGTACNNGTTNCVNTPIDQVGYSSYFGLDITNQTFDPTTGLRDATNNKPTVMWEFADPALGYATSGPAIVKIKATNATGDDGKNGRWFAVFASGPTGPISSTCQFQGSSDQHLQIFVLDLANTSGTWTLNTNYWIIDTGIANAFGASITNGVIDADRANTASAGYYSDDAIYLGYTKRAGSGTASSPYTWTDGGVGRIMTKGSLIPRGNGDSTKDWQWSPVIDNVGSVVTNVGKLQDRKNHHLWLYFGTGRYMYNGDDMASQRQIYAVKEPCYITTASGFDIIDPTCSSTLDSGTISDKTAAGGTTLTDDLDTTKPNGWHVSLDAQNVPTPNMGAERVTTDPVAMTNGSVFFTTFKPSSDPCQFGGQSYMWAFKYDTGFTPALASLRGKALVQVSTGAFQELDLSSSQVFNANYNRRMSSAMQGKPPSDPPPVISSSNNKPVKRIIHIQER